MATVIPRFREMTKAGKAPRPQYRCSDTGITLAALYASTLHSGDPMPPLSSDPPPETGGLVATSRMAVRPRSDCTTGLESF
jgi:hypothetical protein